MGKPREKLESIGFDWVCEQLEDGRSLRDISREIGVNWMTMHDWLHATPLQSARVAASMEAGAEAYEAEAVRVLTDTYTKLESAETVHPHASALASLARERAQAAWRMAGVRNPRRFGDHKRTSADINVTVQHVDALPTADLERLVAQHSALQLLPDGTVEGGGGSGEIEDRPSDESWGPTK